MFAERDGVRVLDRVFQLDENTLAQGEAAHVLSLVGDNADIRRQAVEGGLLPHVVKLLSCGLEEAEGFACAACFKIAKTGICSCLYASFLSVPFI